MRADAAAAAKRVALQSDPHGVRMFEAHEPTSRLSRPRVAETLVVLSLYTVLTFVATWPVLARMSSALPGGGDAWQFYWNLWWVKRAVLDLHQSPYSTPDLYFPFGASLVFHTLNLLPSVLALPITALAGLPLAYNTLVLVGFVVSGYGVYRLALEVLGAELDPAEVAAKQRAVRLASFVAGLCFTFSSYHFVHALGHLDLAMLAWLPFFVLFLFKTWRQPGWRNPIGCGLLLAATALTSWYYALFLLLFTAWFVALQSATGREGGVQQRLWRVAVALATFALIVSPILITTLRLGRRSGRTLNPAFDIDRFSTDLLAFVIPSPLHPLFARSLEPVYSAISGVNSGFEAVAFLGFVPLALALIGVRTVRQTRALWITSAALFAALALGPTVHVGGHVVPMGPLSSALPYRLLTMLPYGDIPRVPARFVVMTMLCLSVVAAAGVWTLLRDLRRPAAFALAALMSALALGENWAAPLSMYSVDAPLYYEQLKDDAAALGIVEVPIPDDPAQYPRRMLYQTVHGKPTFGGYVSRSLPPLSFDAVPGFSQLKTLTTIMDDVIAYDPATLPEISRAVLEVYGANRVVVDKTLMNPLDLERVRSVADGLFGSGARIYEDVQSLAYAVPRADADQRTTIWLDTGWSYLERGQNAVPDRGAIKWRWMADAARVRVMTPKSTTVALKVVAQAFGRVRRVALSVAEHDVGTIVVSTDGGSYETPSFRIPEGTSTITLTSLDGTSATGTTDPRRLSVAVFAVEVRVDE